MNRWGRILWAPVIIAGCLGACTRLPASLPDGGSATDAGRTPPPPPPADAVDWLFVVDNSNSMSEEQASLTAEIPGLVRVLVSGDVDLDGDTDFTPVRSLQIGVVTTDMGVGGHTVPTCERADFGDDGVLRVQGRTDVTGCQASYPSFLSYSVSDGDVDGFASDVSCVAAAGTGGCGFEQQLEAPLKALSPSAPTDWTAPGYAPPRFFQDTFGHGDRENVDFVRRDSILVVMVVTDEEDCSASDPDIYNPTSATYGATDLNLRCWAHGDVALHPVSRYVEGLLQLRSHPSRLVYATISGVPTDLVARVDPATGEPDPIDWDRLIGPTDGTRDERMVERVDPTMTNRLAPSCNVPGRGIAFPPVRILRVGRELEARGAAVSVQSICQASLQSAVRDVARVIGP